MFKLASSCSLLSLVMVVGLVGCGAADENVDQSSQLLVTDGVEAVSTNDQATDSLTDSSFEAVPSADPAMAADALVAAPAEPVDTGCRSRAKDPNDPNTVIITLTNCKGRFGRHSVSGTEIVHFTKDAANPTMIHADFTSQGLTMDGKAASHTASADITIDGATRHIDWNGAFNTVTDAGVAVAHTSDLTIDVDTTAKCRTRNGTAQTTTRPPALDDVHRREGLPRRRRRPYVPDGDGHALGPAERQINHGDAGLRRHVDGGRDAAERQHDQ